MTKVIVITNAPQVRRVHRILILLVLNILPPINFADVVNPATEYPRIHQHVKVILRFLSQFFSINCSYYQILMSVLISSVIIVHSSVPIQMVVTVAHVHRVLAITNKRKHVKRRMVCQFVCRIQ